MNCRFETLPGGKRRAYVQFRGRDLLHFPLVNKGTSFSPAERDAFGIRGLLPNHVTPMEGQVLRTYRHIGRKESALEKYIGMASLLDRNEVLYYRVLLEHLEELMPIVYTPTVGEACRLFSQIFRRGRGLWITPDDKGRIYEVLGNARTDSARLIVVTDNERILGLGDQGAGGMGIPIGKLALYTAAAGIHPSETLPISLDVGTDNKDLLEDELYVGYRKPRLRGAEYDALVEEFVQAVKRRFPQALLQWEDFKKANAFNLLDRYRDELPSFNDDIQGTAAVAVAGVVAGCRITGTKLSEQRILILGAGAAGVGIAELLQTALKREGLEGDALKGAIGVLDSGGLLLDNRDYSDAYKRPFAWPVSLAETAGLNVAEPIGLETAVEVLKPTVLIGTSGQPGVFTEGLVKKMAAQVARPLIFPFSNPTSKSEATPEDLFTWTNGKALVATGSPFEPVNLAGKTLRAAQGNNVYIFPGVGLGALVAQASKVTNAMFTVAADALADTLRPDELDQGMLFPSQSRLREVSRHVGLAVAQEAIRAGVARISDDSDLETLVDDAMWFPEYPELVAE